MISKKYIIPAAAIVVIGGAAVFGISQVKAQTPGSPLSGLVQMIAKKFSLD